jgi:hypothetical protein
MIGITMHLPAVTVEPFLFSPAEPVACEWSQTVGVSLSVLNSYNNRLNGPTYGLNDPIE